MFKIKYNYKIAIFQPSRFRYSYSKCPNTYILCSHIVDYKIRKVCAYFKVLHIERALHCSNYTKRFPNNNCTLQLYLSISHTHLLLRKVKILMKN